MMKYRIYHDWSHWKTGTLHPSPFHRHASYYSFLFVSLLQIYIMMINASRHRQLHRPQPDPRLPPIHPPRDRWGAKMRSA